MKLILSPTQTLWIINNLQSLSVGIEIKPTLMKKSSSIPKHQTMPLSQTKNKNKTMSTIVHTENQNNLQQQQHTTKKNSMSRVGSCAKMANSSCKTSKTNLIKIQSRAVRVGSQRQNGAGQEGMATRNEQLANENKVLREQFCKLQESHIKDKAKIQHLISRMSQLKSQTQSHHAHNQPHPSQQCPNKACHQRQKQLELELHRERIKVYELEHDKKKWDRSREQLRLQYGELLAQIQQLREGQ